MSDLQRIRTEKLRWHSRRALLEIDLVMQRFWQRQTGMLDEEQAEKLERLLEMEDHDLWELLSGRCVDDDPALQEMVGLLRQPTGLRF